MILLRIRDSFVFSQHIFLPYAVIIFFATLVYRLSVFIMITARYAELRDLAFSSYFLSSFPSDAPVLLAALMVLSVLCIVLSETEMAKFIAASLFSWLYLCACLLGVEFFRVYETPFHGAFIGGENFAGPFEVLLSAAAEISVPFIVWTAVFTTVIAFSALFLYRRDRGIYYDGESIGLFFRGMAGLHAAIMVLLAVVSVTGNNASPVGVIAAGKDASSTFNPGLIRELSANPLSNLASGEGRGDGVSERQAVPVRDRGDIIIPEAIREAGEDIPASLTIPRGKVYNIILYIFESFPAEYLALEAGGRPVAGTWKRLAQNGFSALNHYANNPLSANSLLSILASVHEPYGRGLLIQEEPRVPVATLPEILKAAGYRTCHIHSGGLAYAGQNRFLKHRGYDIVMDYFQLKKFSPRWGNTGWGIDERSMIDPAVEFLKAGKGTPFLAVFQPVNPHHPYAIPGREFDIAGAGSEGDPRWKKSWRSYVNSLYYADTVLGMLVDRLEREGLMKNTLLVLVADHGEAFYQHRQNYNHPFFIYEENVHVPFLVYNRDLFPRPRSFDGITRHVDIAPTVLDILGIAAHPLHQGVSLASVRRAQWAMLHTAWRDDYRGVRDGRWKYILRRRDGFEELYDLSKDRAEKVNLAAKEPVVCARFREVLDESAAYRAAYYGKLRGSGALSRTRGAGSTGTGTN